VGVMQTEGYVTNDRKNVEIQKIGYSIVLFTFEYLVDYTCLIVFVPEITRYTNYCQSLEPPKFQIRIILLFNHYLTERFYYFFENTVEVNLRSVFFS